MDAPNWVVILVAIFGIAAAVLLMMVLSDVYRALKRRLATDKNDPLFVPGFFDRDEVVNVHLRDHTLMPRLRLLGFRRKNAHIEDAPPQLMGMVAFQTEDGRRVLIDPNAIKMLEAVPAHATPAQLLADDLERHLAGKLKLDAIKQRMQAGGYGERSQYAALPHYFDDADIRARDAGYKAMQQHALRRYIGLLRAQADAAQLGSINFLEKGERSA